jgi:hypothetical protein
MNDSDKMSKKDTVKTVANANSPQEFLGAVAKIVMWCG